MRPAPRTENDQPALPQQPCRMVTVCKQVAYGHAAGKCQQATAGGQLSPPAVSHRSLELSPLLSALLLNHQVCVLTKNSCLPHAGYGGHPLLLHSKPLHNLLELCCCLINTAAVFPLPTCLLIMSHRDIWWRMRAFWHRAGKRDSTFCRIRMGLSPVTAAQQFHAWSFNQEAVVLTQITQMMRLTVVTPTREKHGTAGHSLPLRLCIDKFLMVLPKAERRAVSLANPSNALWVSQCYRVGPVQKFTYVWRGYREACCLISHLTSTGQALQRRCVTFVNAAPHANALHQERHPKSTYSAPHHWYPFPPHLHGHLGSAVMVGPGSQIYPGSGRLRQPLS